MKPEPPLNQTSIDGSMTTGDCFIAVSVALVWVVVIIWVYVEAREAFD